MASYAFEQAIAHLEAQAARDKTSSNPFGISRDMFETWRGRSVTLVALRDISKDEARRIYELHYWRAFEGDELPPALAIDFSRLAVCSANFFSCSCVSFFSSSFPLSF